MGWLELGTAVGQAVVHPAVVAAWIELVPTAGSDLDEPEERRRNEAWARLARSLRAHSYETFERLGGDELMVLTFSEGTAAYPALLEDIVGATLGGQVSVAAAGAVTSPVELAELGLGEADLVQRVLRDLGPRGEGEASGALAGAASTVAACHAPGRRAWRARVGGAGAVATRTRVPTPSAAAAARVSAGAVSTTI